MKIAMFQPLQFEKSAFNPNQLREEWGLDCSIKYASKGRYAIIHILKSLNLHKGRVLVSSYMCPTVKEALEKYAYELDYFDIVQEDLNPSVKSIEDKFKNNSYIAAVIPSMYGNPADLYTIQEICRQYGVAMIDDAAQSFGAELEGKKVGTFGDGGFFSFSPGKPTSGHMGAFFWSKNIDNYTIDCTRHWLYHRLEYIDFYYNRYRAYNKNNYVGLLLSILVNKYGKLINIDKDEACCFEFPILGGVLRANLYHHEKRNTIVSEFYERFKGNPYFKIIRHVRGIPNNSKIVLLFHEKDYFAKFAERLKKCEISFYVGYNLLDQSCECETSKSIVGKIIELPVEVNKQRMAYLFNCVEKIITALK